MRHYRYKALDHHGVPLEATCEADNRTDVLTRLKGRGYCVVKLDELKEVSGKPLRVGRSVISRFYTMLGNQLTVGVPVLAAIELIGRQERSLEAKRLLQAIAHSVESGSSLSDSLEKFPDLFSSIDRNLIRSGEEGGFLPESLERISQMREWQQKLTSNAWGAAAYPLLLVCVSILLIPALLIYLVPQLEPIFASLRRDSQLPWATSLLLLASRFLQDFGLGVAAGMALLATGVFYLVPRGRLMAFRDRFILRIPFVGDLVRDFVLARFCRIFGTLLQNKIQVLTSLDIASNVIGNQHLAAGLRNAHEGVASGRLLSEALDQAHHIPSDTLAMIGVAEQSNTLGDVLVQIASQLETRTNRKLETAVKLIEPLLLLAMAAFVGFVVLALLLPIFEGQTLG